MGDRCDDCGETFKHHQAPHKPSGIVMHSSCACRYEVKVENGVQIVRKVRVSE